MGERLFYPGVVETPDPASVDAPAVDAVLADLNEAQRTAVEHGDGPLLVVAGAGTGKTMTLAHRVAYLIATGTDPSRILLLTFTRRAAAEMVSRVASILRRVETIEAEAAGNGRVRGRRRPGFAGRLAGGEVWGGTFHAIAARLLRLHGTSVGLDPAFTILDRGDSEDLMNVVRTELGLAKSETRFPQKSTCMDIYGRCVDSRLKVVEVLETAFPWCKDHADDLKRLFAAYVDHKERQAVLDYDDLLLFWHGVLSDPVAGEAMRSRFDRVLVDEYQDTNVLQAEILALLRPDGSGITVVGDDAQAIYGFRAATVRNILDFDKRFGSATLAKLEQNYRSCQPLLDATNAVIALAAERHPKELFSARAGGARPALVTCQDEQEQTEFVIAEILRHREGGVPLKKQAVLFRACHHSLALELELARRNIPFVKYGGLKFAETAHVKDLTAFLRLAANPRDAVAGLRVLTLLPGVGPKIAKALMEQPAEVRESGGASEETPAEGGETRGETPAEGGGASGAGVAAGLFDRWLALDPPPVAGSQWREFIDLVRYLAKASERELPAQVNAVRTFYAPLAEGRFDDVKARLADLEQLEVLASRFPSRDRFLAELTLDPPSWTEDLAGPPYLDEDYLILSTMHSAKGLEWDAVYLIHAADGNIPSDLACGSRDEIEEERRLLYVALTRARDWLTVCVPLRYYRTPRTAMWDVHGYAQVSRFLPDTVKAHFDQRPAGIFVVSGDGAAAAAGTTTSAEIRSRQKAMWD